MPTSTGNRSYFDTPAIYQISVRGTIQPSWCDRLEGMTVHVTETGDVPTVTVLIGELTDQASLTGLLSTLYDLQLTVLSVQRIADANMA